MSQVILYPRAVEGTRVRVWVGAFGRTQAPPLRWRIDGRPAQPAALRAIRSVRGAGLLDDPGRGRAFTGVYEFSGLQPGTRHRVSVDAGDGSSAIDVRTLPAAVPSQQDGWLHVLLVSCFHSAEAKAGQLTAALRRALRRSPPSFSILMGDQVYLDLPTLRDFPGDAARLARKFEDDYVRNWRVNEYARVLAAAPSVSIPDDHEYWNNFPHKSPMIGNSYTGEGRRNWSRAARACYNGFQHAAPRGVVELNIDPLSFLIVDGRSGRDYDRRFAFRPVVRRRIRQWIDDLDRHDRIGLFVTGQSLFRKSVGRLQGKVEDYELPNYGDYPELMAMLAETRRDLFLITGDVHWGRVAKAYDVQNKRRVFEIITSPSALVTTVGADTAKRIGGFFGGIFGPRDPWPRHSRHEEVPAFLAHDVFRSRFPSEKVHPDAQEGDQFAILSFRRFAGHLQARVTYWPIHQRVRDPVDVALPRIPLR